jgi:hypothetical protein
MPVSETANSTKLLPLPSPSAPLPFIIEMAERTQIQLAVVHMFFSPVPVQRSRSARLRLENARRS